MKPKENSVPDALSRSGKKRALESVQKLAKDLIDMGEGPFERIALDPEVKEQVAITRKIKSLTARRRQLRFLARFIAEADHEAAQRAYDEIQDGKRVDAERFHALEEKREELIKGDEETLKRFVEGFPRVDVAQMRKLQRDAQREAAKGGSTKAASRALFRYLRQLQEEHEEASQ